jgi:hypothetical protein
MLSYFQLFKATFRCSKLFHPTLFTIIYVYSKLYLVIYSYFTLGDFWLF